MYKLSMLLSGAKVIIFWCKMSLSPATCNIAYLNSHLSIIIQKHRSQWSKDPLVTGTSSGKDLPWLIPLFLFVYKLINIHTRTKYSIFNSLYINGLHKILVRGIPPIIFWFLCFVLVTELVFLLFTVKHSDTWLWSWVY